MCWQPPDSVSLALFCLQEQAESRLEALHDTVEKQPEAFLECSRNLGEWPKFRESLIGLTDVVRSYFEKLVLVSGACYLSVTRPGWQHPARGCRHCSEKDCSSGPSALHNACLAAVVQKGHCQHMPQRGCRASGRGVTTP